MRMYQHCSLTNQRLGCALLLLGTMCFAQFRRQIEFVEEVLLINQREVESSKAQVSVFYCFQRTCTQVKEREEYCYDSDEAIGYEDDANKSAVNEEYPIDAVVGFDDI